MDATTFQIKRAATTGGEPFKRPSTMKRRATLLLLGIISALGASEANALYFTGSVDWDRTVPVCFSPVSMARSDFKSLSLQMIAAVSRSWAKSTGLKFSGWDECPYPGTIGYINVGFNDLDPNGGGQSIFGPDRSYADVNISVGPGVSDTLVIHEFGHALGFEHENQRPEFVDYDGCRNPNDIKGGNGLHTIPDKHSIMNSTGYCHQNPELSYWDIVGAQNYWGHPNYFADVNGDGTADAIVVNPDGVHVRLTNLKGFMPAENQRNWTGEGFWGHKGTFFADVTGPEADGKSRADAIKVDNNGIFVRASDGSRFVDDTRNWTGRRFAGTWGTYFADVNGDRRADAIKVSDDGVWVALSNGTEFESPTRWLERIPNDRSSGNFFADVTGPDKDGKSRADLITVNGNGSIWVNQALDAGFSATATKWTPGKDFIAMYFADVNGDGKADAITVRGVGLWVRLSNGKVFLDENRVPIDASIMTHRGVFFANANSDAGVEAMTVTDGGIFVSLLSGPFVGRTHNATQGAFYGLWFGKDPRP